jgi:hypothetical protein
MATLANIVAQRIQASREVIETSCDHIVSCLEEFFADWQVATEEESDVFPEPKWRLAARREHSKRSGSSDGPKQVLQTVKALHRARLSQTKEPLANRLAQSSNEIVSGFGESISIEGYMEGRTFTRGETSLFATEVCEI